MKNLFTLLLIFIATISNAQVVTTGNTSGPNTCDGWAAITDSNAVISVQGWYGNGAVVQNGGFSVGNLCPGTYSLSYTDSSNANLTTTFTIASGTPNPCANFYATTNVVQISGANTCDGSIAVNAVGGTTPYSYAWNPSTSMFPTANASNLCGGTYAITVTDGNGCTTTLTVLLSADSTNTNPCNGFSAYMTTTDATSPAICDGSYSIIATGGVMPYSYVIANGMTISTANNMCSGTYTGTVTDANGCAVTVTGVIGNSGGSNFGDTTFFNGTIINDSTVVGSVLSNWIIECGFDYNSVVSATIDSYVQMGDSTLVTWTIGLSDGTTQTIATTYYLNAGNGIYNITLQLTCQIKTNPRYLFINSQLNYQSAGISEVGANSVTIYPNPVINELNLKGLNEKTSFQIIDLLGRKVIFGDISTANESINVETLKQGQYVLVLNNKNGRYTYKIVK